ncbi:MAG: hypothetical protein ABSD98_00645 [Candidatus Korobacteraceae bacterium]
MKLLLTLQNYIAATTYDRKGVNMKQVALLATIVLALAMSASAQDKITFSNLKCYPIPNDKSSYKVVDSKCDIKQLDDGYSINYTYTITANEAGTFISTGWRSAASFSVQGDPDVLPDFAVRIYGSTSLKMSDLAISDGTEYVLGMQCGVLLAPDKVGGTLETLSATYKITLVPVRPQQ